MSDATCAAIREWIPDYVSGRLATRDRAPIATHLEGCDECRAEVELARVIFESRVGVPDGLARRVREAVRHDRASVARPWWGITAAAVAALALGIGISTDDPPGIESAVPGYAYEVEEGDLWLSEDGLIAGAPALEVLTDEALLQLLDEWDSGGAGGAV